MAFSFASDWPAEIESVSADPAFMTSTINLRDIDSKAVLVTTRARIIGIRAQLDVSGIDNPTGNKRLRIQIPYVAYSQRIPRGTFVQVTASPRSPELLTYLITVESDNFSSNRASRTLECVVDVESSATWA